MPNFCKNSSILILISALVLLSTLIHLISNDPLDLSAFSLCSIYILWVGLVSASSICFANKIFGVESYFIAFLLCFLSFFIIELATQKFYLPSWDTQRLITFSIITSILLFSLFRIFSLFEISNKRARAELENKLSSLQSKIAPHFLFNSLNTISELCHENTEQAENAIHSLSKLLRTTLESNTLFHSFEDEVDLCKEYICLEKWRLGKRLNVTWEIVKHKNQTTALLPKLLIQPIIENAIIHGVSPYQTPSNISIKTEITTNTIRVTITNTHCDQKGAPISNGIGMAMNNIKERLFVIYDDKQTLTCNVKDNCYTVSVSFPIKPNSTWLDA